MCVKDGGGKRKPQARTPTLAQSGRQARVWRPQLSCFSPHLPQTIRSNNRLLAHQLQANNCSGRTLPFVVQQPCSCERPARTSARVPCAAFRGCKPRITLTGTSTPPAVSYRAADLLSRCSNPRLSSASGTAAAYYTSGSGDPGCRGGAELPLPPYNAWPRR